MSWLSGIVGRVFTTTSWPFPRGSQNRDGFERNRDNPLNGGPPGPGAVLRLSAAWACVRLISQTISTLPLIVYRRDSNGARVEDRDFWLSNLIRNEPNADMTAQTFWEAYCASLLLRGNAYAEKKRGSVSQVVALNYLHPDSVSGPYKRGIDRYYTVMGSTGSRELHERDVFHTLGFTLDGITGLSPIQYGAGVFGAALNAETSASKTFENGLLPTVAFGMKEVLKESQRDEFRDNFKKELAGALNAGKPPLLEGGMTAFPLGINPKDAQLLESRAWSVEEVCRWFGVPPFMVGYTEKSTSWGSGIEQQNLQFLTYVLSPWLTRIERSLKRSMLTPAEKLTHWAEHSVEGLLRADSAGRAAYLATMANNGFITRDEGRAYDNRPPMGGNAGVLTVQSSMLPIDNLGADPAQAAREALKSWLENGSKQNAP